MESTAGKTRFSSRQPAVDVGRLGDGIVDTPMVERRSLAGGYLGLNHTL